MKIRLLNGTGSLVQCLNLGNIEAINWWVMRCPENDSMLVILTPSQPKLDSILVAGAYKFSHPYERREDEGNALWSGVLHSVSSISTGGVRLLPCMRDGVYLRFQRAMRVTTDDNGLPVRWYAVDSQWVRYRDTDSANHAYAPETRIVEFCTEVATYLCGYISEKYRIRVDRDSIRIPR